MAVMMWRISIKCGPAWLIAGEHKEKKKAYEQLAHYMRLGVRATIERI